MKVVSFSIFKGGTGKTTSTVNTAAALLKRGKRVLLVDLDQQASATRYLDIDPEQSPNLYEVFVGAKSASGAIRQTRSGIDILPSHVLLAAIEEALEPGDELKLADILNPLKQEYDFILIDSPPGKAMLAFNGLAAADLIIIPASAERMAVDGVAILLPSSKRLCGQNSLSPTNSYGYSLPCTALLPPTPPLSCPMHAKYGRVMS